MKFIENIKEGIRSKMKSFLHIDKSQALQIHISEGLDEEAKVIKNMIWYRGDAHELSELYAQLPYKADTFWGAVQTAELKMRKIHTGLPALIVDVLTGIVIDDYNGIEFDGATKADEAEWEEIEKDNKFNEILKNAITEDLSKGRGAFKISFDSEISKYPIIEYFPKDRIEVVKKRGRTREIIFKTNIKENNKNYVLKEIYGYGYIIYKVMDCSSNKEIPIDNLEQTKELESVKFAGAEVDDDGNVIKTGDYMLACLFKIEENAIYDKKTDDFDSLDEVWSQWMEAMRVGRAKTYVPSSLIPRNKKTGALMKGVNAFDNKFIEIEDEAEEDGKNRIQVEQPTIPTDQYINTYITALDLALQGIISPATLGIDTKKVTDPNATAQREKEKTTLHTRGKIVEAIQNTIPELINITFKAIDTVNKKQQIRDVKATVKFGEYANPSFEAQVETIGKGKTQGIMSIEASVDELYGDSKDEKWKADEVARLKAEQGIIDMGEEPSVGNEVVQNENEGINTGASLSNEQNATLGIDKESQGKLSKKANDIGNSKEQIRRNEKR